MATTRIMPLHTGKGRTVGKAISDIIDYVENPEKTDHGRLITSYQCDSRIADAEFLFTKKRYIQKTGRVRGEDDVIAYHLHQSFVPGEITPEEANRLGQDLPAGLPKETTPLSSARTSTRPISITASSGMPSTWTVTGSSETSGAAPGPWGGSTIPSASRTDTPSWRTQNRMERAMASAGRPGKTLPPGAAALMPRQRVISKACRLGWAAEAGAGGRV